MLDDRTPASPASTEFARRPYTQVAEDHGGGDQDMDIKQNGSQVLAESLTAMKPMTPRRSFLKIAGAAALALLGVTGGRADGSPKKKKESTMEIKRAGSQAST